MNQKQIIQIAGVLVVVLAMIVYMVVCVYQIQGYKANWYSFNSIQAANCNQSVWNAISTSGWAFSHQWLSPGQNISHTFYPVCAAYIQQANAITHPLPGVP